MYGNFDLQRRKDIFGNQSKSIIVDAEPPLYSYNGRALTKRPSGPSLKVSGENRRDYVMVDIEANKQRPRQAFTVLDQETGEVYPSIREASRVTKYSCGKICQDTFRNGRFVKLNDDGHIIYYRLITEKNDEV